MLYSAFETTVSVPDSLLVVLITTLIAWDVLTDINGYHYTDQLTSKTTLVGPKESFVCVTSVIQDIQV